MHNPLKNCIVTILLLLTGSALFSQEENYDAVYLQLTKTYILNADGSMDYRYQKKQKLLTYRAFSSLYGETFIVYNPKYQSLKINETYTVMADGKKVSSPENAYNEVLPGFSANAPAFNHLREMVVTHTGLERNAVENLDYMIHSDKGFFPALMGNEVLAEPEPVRELKIIVKIPAGENLFYRSVNSDSKPVVTSGGGQKVYTWQFTDVGAIPQEEFQVAGMGRIPRLIFSTTEDRYGIYQDFLSQDAFNYEVNDGMKNTVSVLLADNRDNLSIALKLQEKVVNEVRLWPVPLRYTGFACRPPADVWNDNGGTSAEKAVLLCAFLKAAGIPADPVFIIRKDFFDRSVGTLLDPEEIAVEASIKEFGVIYLSVSSLNTQSLSYGAAEKVFVTLRKNENPAISETDTPENGTILSGSFSIGSDKKLQGDLSMTFGSNGNPWLSLSRDKSRATGFISGGLSPKDLKEVKISNITPEESFFSCPVKKDNPFRKDTNLLFFELPFLSTGTESFGITLLPADRSTFFEIPSLADENYEFTIDLPEGMEVWLPKSEKEIRNKIGIFRYQVSKEGSRVKVKRSLKLEKRVIPTDLYPEFKVLMDHWNSERYRKLIFSEKT